MTTANNSLSSPRQLLCGQCLLTPFSTATNAAKIASLFGDKYPTAEWSVFIHHVSESDLSYVYDGFLQWVYRGRRYILSRPMRQVSVPYQRAFLFCAPGASQKTLCFDLCDRILE